MWVGPPLLPTPDTHPRTAHTSQKQQRRQQGVKAADAVLKKFPKHGETQAMKALVLNCLERKEEVRPCFVCVRWTTDSFSRKLDDLRQ